MNRPTHIMYGVCMAAICAVETKGYIGLGPVQASSILSIPFVIGGSYFPDIDVKKSKMRQQWISISWLLALPMITSFGLLLMDITEVINLGIFREILSDFMPIAFPIFLNLIVALQLKHRTYTHSAYIPPLLYMLSLFVATNIPTYAYELNTILYGFTTGYTSHLLFDGCTTRGIYLAYPLPYKIHFLPKALRVKTESAGDKIFSTIIIMLTLFYMYINIFGR